MLTYNERARLKQMRENPNSYARIFKSETFKQNINFNGFLTKLVSISDIPNFENQSNIGINVFTYENKRLIPVHLTEYKYKRHVNLLLLSSQANKTVNYHYCTITDLGAFCGKSNFKKCFVCPYCFSKHHKNQNLKEHMKSCQVFCEKALILPEEDKFKFLNFRMYLESFLKLFFWLVPSLEGQSTNVKTSTHLKYTTLQGSNLIAGYGIVTYDTNDKVYYMNTYVGEHAMENFIRQFQEKTN
jgi:hypothetical protein